MADTHTIEMVAEILGAAVSRHASVRDSMNVWLHDNEPLHDHLGIAVTVAAALHPGDARDAARDLLDQLAARGLTIQRAVPAKGNSLATRLLRLAADLAAGAADPARCRVAATALGALAAEARDRDEAVVPAHLRVPVSSDASEGVVRLCSRRRA